MLHKNDFTRKMNDFNTLTKLPKNVVDLGKIIVSTGFEWLPKAQKIANVVTLLTYESVPIESSMSLL